MNRNIWLDGIMGVIVGDALGCPVQFETRKQVARHPVTGMRGHGTFNLPEGSWTDDSSMTLATMDSIKEKKCIDCEDIMYRFDGWLTYGKYTPYGYAYDVGFICSSAIINYKKTHDIAQCGGRNENSNGNGSLMRILPVCLYCFKMQEEGWSDDEAISCIHQVGGLTHAHIRSQIACGLYYFAAREILRNKENNTLNSLIQSGFTKGFQFYERYLEEMDMEELLKEDELSVIPREYPGEELDYYISLRDIGRFEEVPEENIEGSGYVVDTLEAAIWSLITTDTFEEALLKVVNLGLDTDTTAAVAGGLAGLYYGYEAIPEGWLSVIKRKEWIEEMCEHVMR